MSRWRPAAAASSAVITGEGHRRLKEELDDLWRVRRPEVVRALSDAAAEGDRSENAEYIYRKKQLGEIDRRVRYLTNRLRDLRVGHGIRSRASHGSGALRRGAGQLYDARRALSARPFTPLAGEVAPQARRSGANPHASHLPSSVSSTRSAIRYCDWIGR
jgi:hypothetical protein